MTDSRLYVGVDAGGTSTVVVAAHVGGMPRREVGGPANASSLGVDDAANEIITVIRRACAHEKPHAIAIGAAGTGRPEIARTIEDLIASAFPHARVRVGDDAEIALRAAIPEGPGIVLIAGTGSIAFARGETTTARVGGLGYLLGDEGSAFAIGLAAAKLYARVLDGRAMRDETSDLVGRALHAPDRAALLAVMYAARLDVSAIASLAPSIIAFASKGNRPATKIVQDASKELGELIKSSARATGLVDASPTVALSGGLVRENSLLTFLLEQRIVGDLPGAAIVRAADDAALGALRLAMDA